MKVRITAVQMPIQWLDYKKNLDTATSFLERAVREGTDLIVFPELFLTGPLSNGDENRYAESLDGKIVESTSKLAKRHRKHIVGGTFIEKKDDLYFDTSILYGPNGEVIGVYRRKNLLPIERENSLLNNGSESPKTYNTEIGKVGMITCLDIIHPELIKQIPDAEIIICPSFWHVPQKSRKDQPLTLERMMVSYLVGARAFENGSAFVYCNGIGYVGDEKFGTNLIGCSQIFDPSYGVVRINIDGEDYINGEIDLIKINQFKINFRRNLNG